MPGLSYMNRALQLIPKRAEKQQISELHETFVDSGIADILDTIDHQVLYGRRGTGKTHALSYLSSEVTARGDLSLAIDLRTVGSAQGIIDPSSAEATERAARLLIDLLGQFHDSLINAVINDEDLLEDGEFVDKADKLLETITTVRLIGEVERTEESESKSTGKTTGTASIKLASAPSFSVGVNAEKALEGRGLQKETRKGSEKISLNFSDVARALRELGDTLATRRVWLLLDEWSSVPRDLQPYLAEFLNRCIFPVRKFTVKIAAIEQQSNFRIEIDGRFIGIELGADIGAHTNLDDFLVYEGNEEQSRFFFRELFSKHLNNLGEFSNSPASLLDAQDLIRIGFTDTRAFDELVRAAEGVPRDALYIAAKAASRAGKEKISVPLVREATLSWYHTDKTSPLESRPEVRRLLHWIIAKVIRDKKARAFLVNSTDARDELLLALFDARVLHILRRGYSAQDLPGERFDVWGIDYGAYVDLVRTQSAPVGMLPFMDNDGRNVYVDVDVPFQDLRAIRRAILKLGEFYDQDSPTLFD
ncbi:ORC-CDC6 family AAA ATPase [Streptosporangium sandarakinum]|uniref:ORC-CDC6 family AAA ATPase n=1 Tax=Streptosporangium sandarakinum TaxID=1260955 RepID=UPI0037B76211